MAYTGTDADVHWRVQESASGARWADEFRIMNDNRGGVNSANEEG